MFGVGPTSTSPAPGPAASIEFGSVVVSAHVVHEGQTASDVWYFIDGVASTDTPSVLPPIAASASKFPPDMKKLKGLRCRLWYVLKFALTVAFIDFQW